MVRKAENREAGRLSPRQTEILRLIAKGLSNKDIAELLHISNNTVKIHVAAILDVLGAANRTEAAVIYNQSDDALRSVAVGGQADGAREDMLRVSIAVLPFTVYIHDRASESLVHAITDELIMRLSSWRMFTVISEDVVMCRADEAGIYDFSKKRGIKYFVTGTLRMTDELFRVNYSVIEADSRKSIVSGCYETDFIKVPELKIPEVISMKIGAMIVPEILRVEGEQPDESLLDGMNIWHITMRGFCFLDQRTFIATEKAGELFRRAYELNPDYHLACYALVLYHYRMLSEQWTDNPESTIHELGVMAQHCLQLDNRNAHSFFALGVLGIVTGNTRKAADELHQALKLNPCYVMAHVLLGQVYAIMDRIDDAICCMEQALFLDESVLGFGINLGAIGMLHFAAGRYAEAIESSERCLLMVPNSLLSLVVATSAYGLSGMQAEAKSKARQLLKSYPAFNFDNLEVLLRSVHHDHRDRFLQGLVISGVISAQ